MSVIRTRQDAAELAPRIEEPTLSAWLRPIVYAGTGFVFAAPLASTEVATAVAAGALIGSLLGRSLAAGGLRLWVIVVLGVCGLLTAALFGGLLTGTAPLASALGPAAALRVASAVGLGLGTIAVALVLRAAALRRGLFRALEVGFVGFAFAQLVVAHRGGAINRPFELADSIIAAGGDPRHALVAIGGFAATVAVIFLLSERSPWRAVMHLVLAALVLLLVVGATQLMGLPEAPMSSTGLNLRAGEDGEGGKPKPNGGGRTDEQRPDEAPEFRDDYTTHGRQIPLAVVLLHDDFSPPGSLYYFRQAAFSQYNGRRLVAATRDGVDDDLASQFVFEPTQLPGAPRGSEQRTELETTVALLAEHNRPFALEAPLELRPEPNPDPGRFRRVYRARSAAFSAEMVELIGRQVGEPTWDADVLDHYLQTPSDPRYAELAEEITADLPDWARHDAVARGLKVTHWLSKEGIYSLKSGHAKAEDPTADFLFGDRTGYCVHFAHAAVYLMRELGVPARVGTGYAIEEAARQGGSAILLSAAHSHAWPELYVEGVGWVVADVAPERTLDAPPAPPDGDLQRLLGEMARGLDPVPPAEHRPFEPVARLARNLPGHVGRALGVLIPTLLLLGYLIKLWRRFAPRLVGAPSRRRTAYRAQLDRLSEVSLVREFGESHEAFARRLSSRVPSFGELTADHVAASFGSTEAREATDPARVRALSAGVLRELGRLVSLRRRLVGVLNPYSWLRTR